MKPYFLMFLFFVIFACSKSDDNPILSLPPATQTGENTFGCYIDGQLLIPRSGTGTWMGPDPGMAFIDGVGSYYEIDVHDFASERTGSIVLHIMYLDSIGKGEYIVNTSNCNDSFLSPSTTNIFCRVWDYEENIYKYYCSTDNSGVINITRYDINADIVSGTFSCTAVNRDNPNDTIEITKGRFDINWRTLTPYTEFP